MVVLAMTGKKIREKTVYRALSLSGYTGGGAPASVDVKNGTIIRIRPLHYDRNRTKKELNLWRFERNSKTFEPIMKSLPAPFSLAYKKRAYSPNRIRYPLKRIDWDPDGERHPENRGKSKYTRISWDEAAGIIANELKRVHQKYGPYAVLAQADGHGENKLINAAHGCQILLHDTLGGFTQQQRNPDSWEGWYWGSKHVWGNGWVGMMAPQTNVVKDVTENSDLLLVWGGDPETTTWGLAGQCSTRLSYFWSEVGIKQVYICPDLNYGAAVHADKWIPVLPNTDAALQLAIIYIWITENLYDKEYMKTHTVGFNKVKDYVTGKEDGVPKTPAWASSKCGVQEWTIKALAREFATRTTSIVHVCGGSMIRGPYSHEPARLEAILLSMQGLGKPGVHQVVAMTSIRDNIPKSAHKALSAFSPTKPGDRILRPHSCAHTIASKQFIPKTMIHEAILHPPITFSGSGACAAPVEDQFIKYTYPLPKEEGGNEIHMIWTDSPCRTTCWNAGNKTIEAFRSPKIECIIAQHPWLENDCLLADIILPANTTFEVDDIVLNSMHGIDIPSVMLQKQAIEPVGESKSDYEIVLEIANKLGKYDDVTQGKSISEWIKSCFEIMGLPELISWEDFNEKGYYLFPTPPDWEKYPAGMIRFYQDPENNPLPTPSGKLEFYSERLARYFPDDKERLPTPHWIERGETHDERPSGKRAAKFPLLFVSNHPRWRMHATCDDISWIREIPTCKVIGWDGYMYEPVWINPKDAKKRRINSGDIVKIHNQRGAVLGGAYVTERIMPGVVLQDHGARCDWIIPGELDRGGANNLISPGGLVSKNCGGEVTSGFLVEVEKVSKAQMEEWKKHYPDAFERKYDMASGLCFDAWIDEGI
jgi:molybdopterin guanine dinucleotide-containing S/N-oxide reductase-like protein